MDVQLNTTLDFWKRANSVEEYKKEIWQSNYLRTKGLAPTYIGLHNPCGYRKLLDESSLCKDRNQFHCNDVENKSQNALREADEILERVKSTEQPVNGYNTTWELIAVQNRSAAFESSTIHKLLKVQEIQEYIQQSLDCFEADAVRLTVEPIIEDTTQSKHHTVMSRRTSSTTKKDNRKVYLPTCVWKQSDRGRTVLTNNIRRRQHQDRL